jgi:hypothetical protein
VTDLTARYTHLSAQYRAAVGAEDAAWNRLVPLTGAEDSYGVLQAAARRASDIRRDLSGQLDAELAAFTAATDGLVSQIWDVTAHPAGCQCHGCTGGDPSWAATAADDDPRWIEEAERNTDGYGA